MLKRDHHEEPTTPLAESKRPRDSLGNGGGSLQDLRTPLKNVGLTNSPSFDFISPRRRPEEAEEEERRRNRAEMIKRQQENREALKSPAAGASPRAELPSSTLKRSVSGNIENGSSPSSVMSSSNLVAQGSRSILTASKSKLSISSTRLSTAQPPLPLSVEQMTKSFEEWMKMAADNKINSKNSWNFALIDYFSELTFLKDGDSINFQKASCTLDGCVKIYASRVDSVVDETTKLLNGLSEKTSSKFKTEEDDEEVRDDPEDSEIKTTKSAKLKKSSLRTIETIEKNFENLILKNFDLEFSIDPLFKKTSAEFDESGKGSLIRNLECSPIDNLIIFDSSDKIPMDFNILPDAEVKGETENDQIDISILNSIFGSLIIDLDSEMTSICPSFGDYNFNNSVSDIKGTLEKLSRISPNVPILESKDLEVLIENENGSDDYDDIIDDKMSFIPDEDYFDDVHDENDGIRSSDAQSANGNWQDQGRKSVQWANNDVTDETGLSYFDGALKQTWAGPEHWKIRKSQRIINNTNSTADSINPVTQSKSRRSSKVEKAAIDFLNSVIDFRQIFSKPTNSSQITLTKASIIERNENEHLLPNDLHFSSASLLKLFIKPSWKKQLGDQGNVRTRVTRSSSKSSIESTSNFVEKDFWISQEDHQNGLYQDDLSGNKEDEDYDTRLSEGGGYMDNDDNFVSYYENEEVSETENIQDPQNQNTSGQTSTDLVLDFSKNLVAAPKFTFASQLNYARVAKRVDVAKLKATLWNELMKETNDNGSTKNTFKKEKLQDQSATTSFSSLINNLAKTYPSDALAEVSVPYCFICLLHLANENNLEIKLSDSKADLIILN